MPTSTVNGKTDGEARFPVVQEMEVPPPLDVGDEHVIPSIVTIKAPLKPVPLIVTDSPPLADILILERDVILGVLDSL